MDYIDYSDSFPEALYAQGKGRNMLILRRLENPVRRMDGKLGRYELEYRWLSTECKHPRDEAWACVRGNEFIFLTPQEVRWARKRAQVNLFDHFELL